MAVLGGMVLHGGATMVLGNEKNIRSMTTAFSADTRSVVGDGSKIRFWHDTWCGYIALKGHCPVLYRIACQQEVLEVGLMKIFGDSHQWNVSFLELHMIGKSGSLQNSSVYCTPWR